MKLTLSVSWQPAAVDFLGEYFISEMLRLRVSEILPLLQEFLIQKKVLVLIQF